MRDALFVLLALCMTFFANKIGIPARIPSAWVRVPVLLALIPIHFGLNVLRALVGTPSALVNWRFYVGALSVYGGLLIGRAVGKA